MTMRDAVRRLGRLGFREENGKKHRKFIHPDGRMVVLPHHLKHDRLYGGTASAVKAILKGA